jgi:hypothetical protein
LGDWTLGELTAALSERKSYEDWLVGNKSTLASLPSKARSELNELLPRVAARYRELIVAWASDPQHARSVLILLRGVFGV